MTEEQQRYARAWRRFRWLQALTAAGGLLGFAWLFGFLELFSGPGPLLRQPPIRQALVYSGAFFGMMIIGFGLMVPYARFHCPCCGKLFFDGPLKWPQNEKICANCGTAFGMLPPSDADEARSHLHRNNRHPG